MATSKDINALMMGINNDGKLIPLRLVNGSVFLDPSTSIETIGAMRFIDVNGISYGVNQIEGKLRVSTMPYLYDIVEHNVAGHTPWTKIGFTPTMNNTENDLWSVAGIINYPATAIQMEVYSSSNTDIGTIIKTGTSTGGSTTTLIDSGANFNAATAVAIGDCVILDKAGASPEYGWVTTVVSNTELTIAGGFSVGGSGALRDYHIVDYSATSGAHAVKISYLDIAFAEHKEIVILGGSTPVDTVNTNIYRVNAFRVIAAGSGTKPVGALSLRHTTGSPVYSGITAGYTRARNSTYTVPAAHTLYVTEFCVAYGYAAAQTHYARIYIRATQNEEFRTPGIFYPFTEVVCANSSQLVTLDIPTKILSGVDIKASGVSSTTTGVASIAIRGWLEE